MPESVSFHTKGQLAQLMLQRAVESGVSFAWVAGDEVYGNDRRLRLWLERLDVSHVLAIKSTEKLWASTEKGPVRFGLTVSCRKLTKLVGARSARATVPRDPRSKTGPR